MKISLLKLAPAIAAGVLIFNSSRLGGTADEIAVTNSSALRLAAIFGDNIVLRRQQTVPVWGWNAPDADVKVVVIVSKRASAVWLVTRNGVGTKQPRDLYEKLSLPVEHI